MNPMNEKSFEYLSHHGTTFKCSRCDLADTIWVIWPEDETGARGLEEDAYFWQDIAEMVGYHAVNIRPELNGFAGYDTFHFEVVEKEEDDDG